MVFHQQIRPSRYCLIFIMRIPISPIFSEICSTQYFVVFLGHFWTPRCGPGVNDQATEHLWPKGFHVFFYIMTISLIVSEITFQTRCEARQTVPRIARTVTTYPNVLIYTPEPEVLFYILSHVIWSIVFGNERKIYLGNVYGTRFQVHQFYTCSLMRHLINNYGCHLICLVKMEKQ